MIHITNYDKLTYEGIKLTVDAPNLTIMVDEDNNALKSAEPIKWNYGRHFCISLFDRESLDEDYRARTVATKHSQWQIKDDSIDILRHQARLDKFFEAIDSEYDVIVCTPTNFKINQDFYNEVFKRVKYKWIIMETFFNSNLTEVGKCIDFQYLIDNEDEQGWNKIYNSFYTEEADSAKWNYIYFNPRIIEPKYLSCLQHKVTKTHRYCDWIYGINNRRLLILDDTILADRDFSNLDISMSARALLDLYQPKSATIATLFAPINRSSKDSNEPFEFVESQEFKKECDNADNIVTYSAFDNGDNRIF